MSKEEIDGWVVENGYAKRNNWSATIEVHRQVAEVGDNDTGYARVPLPVFAELLRQHGYKVTPPQSDCCGRGCGECA